MNMKLLGDYFNGQFSHPQGVDLSSADEKILKTCPAELNVQLWEAGIYYKHIDKVIESAHKGFQTWRKLSLAERANYLKKYQEVVRARKDDIAMAVALEVGKPLWEAKTEAAAVDGKVSVTISDSMKRIEQETIKDVMPKIDGHTVYKPLGLLL